MFGWLKKQISKLRNLFRKNPGEKIIQNTIKTTEALVRESRQQRADSERIRKAAKTQVKSTTKHPTKEQIKSAAKLSKKARTFSNSLEERSKVARKAAAEIKASGLEAQKSRLTGQLEEVKNQITAITNKIPKNTKGLKNTIARKKLVPLLRRKAMLGKQIEQTEKAMQLQKRIQGNITEVAGWLDKQATKAGQIARRAATVASKTPAKARANKKGGHGIY